MIKKSAHFARRHKFKLVFSLPVVMLLVFNFGFRLPTSVMSVLPQSDLPLTVGDSLTIDIVVDTSRPVNVVGSIINFSPDYLRVTEINESGSIISLWAEKPSYRNDFGVIHFGGGIIGKDGFLGKGKILSITFMTLKSGRTDIQLSNTAVLAHDGRGTQVLTGSENATYMIQSIDPPSPDLNSDGVVSFTDVSIMLIKIMSRYESKHDLNQDGKVDILDMNLLRDSM